MKLNLYIWKNIIYVGKETDLLQNGDYGQATNVVLTLMNDLFDNSYCVYVDK